MNSPSANRSGTRSQSRVQALCDEICRRLVDTPLQPGDRLPTETELVEEYGVSRTVVREAMSRLQAAGVVETRHGVGTFVVSLPGAFDLGPALGTVEEVLRMLELRICLESEAAGLAATRRSDAELEEIREAHDTFATISRATGPTPEADFRFHVAICRSTHNQYFHDVLLHFGKLIIPRAGLKVPPPNGAGPVEDIDRLNHEHEDIFNAISRQDADGARIAMRAHLNNSRERLRRA